MVVVTELMISHEENNHEGNDTVVTIRHKFILVFSYSLISMRLIDYRTVVSTNTCYYSENQVFGGVTIRVLCSKRGCY